MYYDYKRLTRAYILQIKFQLYMFDVNVVIHPNDQRRHNVCVSIKV